MTQFLDNMGNRGHGGTSTTFNLDALMKKQDNRLERIEAAANDYNF